MHAHAPAPAAKTVSVAPVRQTSSAPARQRAPATGPSPAYAGFDFADIAVDAPILQRKLEIGAADDPLEHEAERVADLVMRSSETGHGSNNGSAPNPAPALQLTPAVPLLTRACAGCDDDELQKSPLVSPDANAGTATEATEASVRGVVHAPGQPLDPGARAFFEPRFGRDLSHIRVHTDSAAGSTAREVNALAYTMGSNIVFAPGQYRPHSPAGRRLLAHELAHTIQQSTGAANTSRTIRRQPSPGSIDTPTQATPAQANPTQADPTQADPTPDQGSTPPAQSGQEKGDKADATPSAGGRVIRLIVARDDGILTIETFEADYLYELDQMNIPEGTYNATVTVRGNNEVVFTFGPEFSGQLFHFNYRINRGQDNPATLLKGQKTVTIEVVAQHDTIPGAKPIRCLLPLAPQELIKVSKSSKPLFKPVTKKYKWHIGSVPLGYLGWVDIDAEAGLSLAGLLSYGWGPGVLRDICLFHIVGKDVYGGSASFRFGAALSPSVNAKGKLKAVASYLSVVDLVSIEGTLDASAIGRLTGNLDARVDLEYDRRTGDWSFDAEALLSGSAGLRLTATAGAAIELLYKEVWSKQWKLLDADFHIGWTGGVRIGTDTKPQLTFGNIGLLSEGDQAASGGAGGPSLPTASAPDPLATEAKFDEPEKVLEAAINKDTGDPAKIPEGRSPDDALPIIWYKPLNIYPKEVHIPRAIQPAVLDRDDGPTPVEYLVAGRSRTEDIGVGEDDKTHQTNWPLPVRRGNNPGKRFQYVEKTAGDTVKDRLRNTFNTRLLAAGQTLAGNGWDMDHVHEKQFGGQDALPNLFPAESAANRQAGDLHNQELDEYRMTIGNIAGLWFEIVEVRNP